MLFNSLEYLIFLPIVISVYWVLLGKSKNSQNTFLLLASYFFYGMWNWKFLFLLMFSTLLDFISGIVIEKSSSENKRKWMLYSSVCINLGFLAFFKYFNFFSEMVADIKRLFNLGGSSHLILDLVIPVGISFYTFHGLSYVFDVYNGKLKARRNIIDYSLFVSFFPLLVAGPIERAHHLLPQIEQDRNFSREGFYDGLRQILWGLIKKIVIADNCATYANLIFDNPGDYSGSTLMVGAVLFAFQIYGDFSGYSDIALGSARLMGFELLRNFSYPYFSRNLSEFWQRWHISLSSWFRDYLYIPLGGNKTTKLRRIANVLIVFLVSGFWHGANWTFIAWGFVNAVFVIQNNFLSPKWSDNFKLTNKRLIGIYHIFQIVLTFFITCLIWVFFRAESITASLDYLRGIFSADFFTLPQVRSTLVFASLAVFVALEWIGKNHDFAFRNAFNIKLRFVRWSLYLFMVAVILLLGANPQTFIYFQF